MRQGNVTDWARESWQASHDYAYAAILADPCGPLPAERPVVTEEMTRRLIPIVRRQVARGGLRLARVLDEAFAPDSPWAAAAGAAWTSSGTTVTARRFSA